jgi:hypothetical protein
MADPINVEQIKPILDELKRRGINLHPDESAPITRDGILAAAQHELTQRQQAEPAPGRSTLQTAGAVVSDVAQGVTEAPAAVYRGATGAVKEAAQNLGGVAEWLDKKTGVDFDMGTTGNATADKALGYVMRPLDAVADLAEFAQGAFSKPESVTGNVTESIAQFVTGFLGVGRAAKTLGVAAPKTAKGAMAQGAAKGAPVDALVFDGTDERLSNLINEHEFLRNPITEYLAAKPGDTKAEGALKNALEGLIIGPSLDLLILGAKAVKQARLGNKEAAARAAADADNLYRRMINDLDPRGADEPFVPAELQAPAAKPAEAPAVKPGDPAAPIDVPEVKVETAPGTQGQLPLEFPRDPNNARQTMSKDGRQLDPQMASPTAKEAAQEPPGARLQKFTPEEEAAVEAAIHKRFVVGRDMALTSDEFNMRRLNGDDDILAATNSIAKAIEAKIDKAAGGNADRVRDFDMVKRNADRVADMFGVNQDALFNVLGRDGDTVRQLDSRVLAYRTLMLSVVDEAAAKASAALAGGQNAAQLAAEAIHAARIAAQVIAQVKGIQTNIARTLGAMRITANNTGMAKGISFTELAKNLEGRGLSDADRLVLRQLSNFGANPKGMRKFLENSFGRRVQDSFIEYYVNALLSGPKTHIVNLVSNTAHALYRPMERALAGVMPGGVGGREAFKGAVDEYVGMFHAINDAFRMAGMALKQGDQMLDAGGVTAAEREGFGKNAISARRWGLSKDIYNERGDIIRTETTPYLSWMVDGIGTVVNVPSRLLTTQDEFFKQIAYRSYIYKEAAGQARSLNLKGKAFDDFVAERFTKAFDENGVRGTDERGIQEARELTFTQDLEYGIGDWLQQGAGRFPMMRMVIPFVRTPTNIFRWVWQHTPLINRLQRQHAEDIAAGGERARLASARTTMGGAFYTAGAFLALNGLITGGGPTDPDLRRAKEATGWQPYSFKVGDKYIAFNRFDPFMMPFGLVADFVDEAGRVPERALMEIGGGMVAALAKNLSSKTYLQGITNIFNAYADVISGRSDSGLKSWIYRTAGAVAVPSVVASFKGEDEALREVRSVMDSIKSRLPGEGGTKSLPPVRNILGEKAEAPAFIGPDAFSPIGYRTDKKDALADELSRLMIKGDAALMRVSPRLGETTIDLREVTLANGQNAYDRLQELTSTVRAGRGTMREALTDLINSERYKAASPGDRDYATTPGTKLWMISQYVQRYREAARGQLLRENDDLREMFMAETRRARTTGRDGPQERVYKPPSFLESILGK